MIEQLGGVGAVPINLNAVSPVPILLVGLQGSGKTTTAGKLALRFRERLKKKVLLASLDTQRPAAQLQLQQLAEQARVPSLPIIAGQTPVQIALRAMDTGRREGYDIVLLDTAGRLSINEALMAEVSEIRAATNPAETLLVVDAMTGQDAVNTAKAFNDAVGVTGIVLTRMDGDARGGAALSMRAITPAPRSSWSVSARNRTRSKTSTPSVSPAAFWAWATSSAWSKKPRKRSIRRKPKNSPPK